MNLSSSGGMATPRGNANGEETEARLSIQMSFRSWKRGKEKRPYDRQRDQPPESQSSMLYTVQKPSQVKTSLSVPMEKQQGEEAVLKIQATALWFGSRGKGSGKVSIWGYSLPTYFPQFFTHSGMYAVHVVACPGLWVKRSKSVTPRFVLSQPHCSQIIPANNSSLLYRHFSSCFSLELLFRASLGRAGQADLT